MNCSRVPQRCEARPPRRRWESRAVPSRRSRLATSAGCRYSASFRLAVEASGRDPVERSHHGHGCQSAVGRRGCCSSRLATTDRASRAVDGLLERSACGLRRLAEEVSRQRSTDGSSRSTRTTVAEERARREAEDMVRDSTERYVAYLRLRSTARHGTVAAGACQDSGGGSVEGPSSRVAGTAIPPTALCGRCRISSTTPAAVRPLRLTRHVCSSTSAMPFGT